MRAATCLEGWQSCREGWDGSGFHPCRIKHAAARCFLRSRGMSEQTSYEVAAATAAEMAEAHDKLLHFQRPARFSD